MSLQINQKLTDQAVKSILRGDVTQAGFRGGVMPAFSGGAISAFEGRGGVIPAFVGLAQSSNGPSSPDSYRDESESALYRTNKILYTQVIAIKKTHRSDESFLFVHLRYGFCGRCRGKQKIIELLPLKS